MCPGDYFSELNVLVGTKLDEMVLPEDEVLKKLNAVSTSKRLANMVRRHTLFFILLIAVIGTV